MLRRHCSQVSLHLDGIKRSQYGQSRQTLISLSVNSIGIFFGVP